MRILVTSDWHGDKITAGLPRFDDVARSARATVELAKRERCDGYVFMGDLADPGPRAHRCSALAIELALDLERAGIWSRWLVGNHDPVEDGSGSSTLSPLAAMRKSDWVSDRSTFFEGSVYSVWDEPKTEWIESGVLAIALPHPTRGKIYDPMSFIRGIDRDPWLPIVFGHLTVPGIEPGSETREMPRGREVCYPIEAIRERWGNCAVMLNGHYHRQHRAHESAVIVPGSLERLTKGEVVNVPGCLILEV